MPTARTSTKGAYRAAQVCSQLSQRLKRMMPDYADCVGLSVVEIDYVADLDADNDECTANRFDGDDRTDLEDE
jgi:hypothetical protein